jgi:uncharacterized protein (DUF433 family)
MMQSVIILDKNIRSGQPCVRGTRITVGDVLSYLAAGMSSQKITNDFPELSHEAIMAAVAHNTPQ